MKKIYLGFLISLFTTAINGQGVNFEWANSLGGTNSDYGESMQIYLTQK